MSGELQKMIPQLVVLVLMIAGTIGMALYRAMIAKKQDFHLHFNAAEVKDVGQQVSTASTLGWIDRWGKFLTAATIIYFVVLAGYVLYQQWLKTSSNIITN